VVKSSCQGHSRQTASSTSSSGAARVRELWQTAAGVWACALGGESASASVVGPGTGSGWHCDGMHAATPATPAMPATPATPAMPGYIKNAGPATRTTPSPGPVFTSSRFSLLPPLQVPPPTSPALCAHHITHLAAIPCRHPPTSLSRRHRPETLLLCSSCPAAGAGAGAGVSHLPSWPWPWQRARVRVRVRVVCVLVLVRVLYQFQEPAQLVT
jgi:hypothetical protein